MEISPIAHIRTDFDEKFGIPRQSGLVKNLPGRIVFEPQYSRAEAVRELDGFSHIWLIWQFSENTDAKWNPTVRPPRLGGNRRVGVFASRSPFRPNSLGLSCVKVESVEYDSAGNPVIFVSGADMLDNTPIFDIKPYIPLSDCYPDAVGGYTEKTKEHKLNVEVEDDLLSLFPERKRDALLKVLSLDPRPGYDDTPEKSYGMHFSGFNIEFYADNGTLFVTDIKKI